MAQLKSLSEQMRVAASVAEQYHQIVSSMPYGQMPGLPMVHAGTGGVNDVFAFAAGPGRKRKLMDEDDGKKTRRKRDPTMPKRPPSAYLFYQNEVRGQVKQAYPDRPHHEILGYISQQWNGMTEEEKRPYDQKQKAAKATYDEQMAEWNIAHGIPPKVAKAATQATPVKDTTVASTETSDVEGPEDESEETSKVEGELDHEEEEQDEEEDEEEEEAPPPPPPTKKVTVIKSPSSRTTKASAPAKGKKSGKA
jgi:hypothetical protein